MKRLAFVLTVAGTLAGCDAVETAVVLRGIAAPESNTAMGAFTCEFPADPQDFLVGITLDVGSSFKLTLPVAVENRLAETNLDLGSPTRMANTPVSNDVTPLRYELRWECDSTGFTSDLGPLIVPSFDPLRPFCLDRRADVNAQFIGFDFVPVDSGQTVEPGTTGTVLVKFVPFQLGTAFSDAIRIGRLADDCCRTPGSSCDGQTSSTSCDELRDIFMTLDPAGSFDLRVDSDQSGVASEDLIRYRPFSQFDGNYSIGVSSQNAVAALSFGASYPLRARGVMEVVTADGYSITSSELVTQVGLCRNCGLLSSPTTRAPYPTNPCLGL